MRELFKIIPLCLLLFTASCAEIVVKHVDYKDGIEIPEDAHPAPIKLSKIKIFLPPGTEIGLESGIGPWWFGGICSARNYPVSRNILFRKFESEYLQQSFADALESQGYDVTNDVEQDFEYEDELARAEYFISARIKDVDLDLCRRGRIKLFDAYPSSPNAIKGKLYMQIEWSVYDALKRTVVYKTTTEGYTRRDYPNIEGLKLLMMDAFEMAAHNLGADQHFYNLIVEGHKPPPNVYAPFGAHKKKAPRPRQFDPLEDVTINNPPLRTQSFQKIAEDKRRNAVTIQKLGHGSGFFISKEGHIITNQHVVGYSDRIRIVLADKKKSFTAEVLRIDKARDVALLKLTDPSKLPKSYLDNMPLLPIRTELPKVSEDVYAIGTPKHRDILDNTVSKGIVSNHRTYKHDGIALDFIQADVNVHGGNSGGPLLDKNGNIVGITVIALFPDPDNHAINLNLFIPIEEALKALDITLD